MAVHDLTFKDYITKCAMLRGNQTAFVSGEERISFTQYASDVGRLAAGLSSLGVTKGTRIGIVAHNCYEFFLLYGAAACLGSIVVAINRRLKTEEIEFILDDCTPKVVVASPEHVNELAAIVDQRPYVTRRLVIGEPTADFDPFDAFSHCADDLEVAGIADNDPFIMIYTAAVAGRPKGAILTHGNVVACGFQTMIPMKIDARDAHVNLMPLYHVAGLSLAVSVMQAGGRNIIMKRFDAQQAVELIQREQATIIVTVPPMLSSILEKAESSGSSLRSLRVVASMFDDPAVIRRCQETTGAQFWVGYGQTETSGYITLSPFEEEPGSSGKEGPMARIRLINEHEQEVPTGDQGEIVLKGPVVFQQYWGLPHETLHTFREGWHHTGDIGRLDERGFLWYIKRKPEKELIKPGGENVYPGEVERAILEHPDVREACVFGVPDREWGEAIKAVCVREAGSALTPEELIDFVGSRIARYKKPKYVIFAELLPRANDGSVNREELKVLFRQK